MKCSIFVIALSVVILLQTSQVRGLPPAQCSPELIDDVPARIRKVCITLSTIYELGTAMENYINDKIPILRDGNNAAPGVKRQDVDHVFLRFGRRR